MALPAKAKMAVDKGLAMWAREGRDGRVKVVNMLCDKRLCTADVLGVVNPDCD